MKQLFQRFLLFLLMCCLLAACGPIGGVIPASQQPSTPTATAPLTQGLMPPLRKAIRDSCPTDLQNATTCFTPHALRVAYGVQSLIERGFTGKGQTTHCSMNGMRIYPTWPGNVDLDGSLRTSVDT